MFIRKILTEETPLGFDINLVMEMITRSYKMELNDFKKGTIVTSLMLSNLLMSNFDFLIYNTTDNYLGFNEILINESEGSVVLGRTKHNSIELSVPSPFEDEGTVPIQDLYKNGLDKYTMFTHTQINYFSIHINETSGRSHKPLPNVKYRVALKTTIVDLITSFKMRFPKVIKDI